MLGALVLAVVCGTASGWGADSTGNCALEDQSHPQSIVRQKLYRAFCGVGQPIVLVDSLPAAVGIETCFQADTLSCVTYWMTAVNGAGMESPCRAAISFPRVVGVGNPASAAPESGDRYFDLAGRRLPHPPETPGVYWLKKPGKQARLVVLGRK